MERSGKPYGEAEARMHALQVLRNASVFENGKGIGEVADLQVPADFRIPPDVFKELVEIRRELRAEFNGLKGVSHARLRKIEIMADLTRIHMLFSQRAQQDLENSMKNKGQF